MGLFGKLFGKEKELPQLDAASPAAARLNNLASVLEPFVTKVHDKMDMVPAENTVYVYIGKPPGMFGIAWFENGQEVNLKTFSASKGLKQKQQQLLYGRLGEAYEEFSAAPRYEATIAGKKVSVTPSEELAKKIAQIIHEALD